MVLERRCFRLFRAASRSAGIRGMPDRIERWCDSKVGIVLLNWPREAMRYDRKEFGGPAESDEETAREDSGMPSIKETLATLTLV